MKEIIIVGYNNFTKEVIKKIKAKKNIKIILDDLTDDTSFDGIAIDKISNINKYKNVTRYSKHKIWRFTIHRRRI